MRCKVKEMTSSVLHGNREELETGKGQGTSMERKEIAD